MRDSKEIKLIMVGNVNKGGKEKWKQAKKIRIILMDSMTFITPIFAMIQYQEQLQLILISPDVESCGLSRKMDIKMKPIQLGYMDNGTGKHQSNTVWYIGGGMSLYINTWFRKERRRYATNKGAC